MDRNLAAALAKFNLSSLKFPQLVGILAGCLVFVTTIAVVIYLLYASGTLSGAFQELQVGVKNAPVKPKSKEEESVSPYSTQPELYEHLIEARLTLPEKLSLPRIDGPHVAIRHLTSADIHDLFLALNGSPQYDESGYDPVRLWGWSEMPYKQRSYPKPIKSQPWKSEDEFRQFIQLEEEYARKTFIVIEEKEFRKVVGFISLADHQVLNLSLRIDTIMITPAFQGKKRGHEALLLLLEWLFTHGYRRITAESDERHIIYRKFLMRCLFQIEVILRKNRIVANRNCNSALYFMLNSDWPQIEIHFKKMLGIPLKKEVKAAEIVKFSFSIINDETSTSVVKATSNHHNGDNGKTKSQKKKKNKKNKKDQ